MIATNIEQSKRLLAAGINPGSADMRWEQFLELVPRLCYQPNVMPLIAPKVIPAWSLSALWQALHAAGEIYEFSTDTGPDELIESLVTIICSHYAPAPSEQ